MTEVLHVDTLLGPGRFLLDPASRPVATLMLGHGAGGGVTAFDLELLARRLPELGVTVARFEQPWRTAGRRVAVRPPQLDICWRAGVEFLLARGDCPPRLFFGGRSAGARVACRTARDFSVAGVICLAFPLHLPGQPAKSRASELLLPSAPRLVLQGTNDAFGRPDEIRAAARDDPGVVMVELPGADHGFRLAKSSAFTAADLRALVVAETADFLLPAPDRVLGRE